MKNKKGQMMLFGLIVMVFIFVVAVSLISPMKGIIQEFRTDNHCQWTNLSINNRALCTIVDLYLPYFIITLLVGSAAYLFYRTSIAS